MTLYVLSRQWPPGFWHDIELYFAEMKAASALIKVLLQLVLLVYQLLPALATTLANKLPYTDLVDSRYTRKSSRSKIPNVKIDERTYQVWSQKRITVVFFRHKILVSSYTRNMHDCTYCFWNLIVLLHTPPSKVQERTQDIWIWKMWKPS